MTNNIITPTVHLNGTSRQDLLDGYCEAIDALHEAGRKMAAAYPNGRDYYMQRNDENGRHPLGRAMDQHEARMTKLKEIIGELEHIAEAIQNV